VRRAAACAGLVLLGGAISVIVRSALADSPQATAAATGRIAGPLIRSTLPAWRAPGGRFTVTGFAGAREAVVLRASGRILARARSGRLGAFTLPARAPSASAVLTLSTSIDRVRVGRLVVRPVQLAAVGDITPGESVGPTVVARGGAYPWGEVGALLRQADITTANLEGAISTRGIPVPNKEFHFRGPRALLTGARQYGGLDVVTLANNHVMDYGAEALSDTLNAARASGIATIGAGMNLGRASRRVLIESGGLRIAFLGYSDVNPAGFIATSTSPGTAKADVDAIARDVTAARRSADLVVCWFHWGVELERTPNERQQQFAAAALSAGAKVVLGAHPHVLGAVERRAGHSIVAWTLGNFVFPSGKAVTLQTAILRVRLASTGVVGYQLTPATAGVRPALRNRRD
jgi:poly-gamma-glutamate capsule biosynthesis protein CapA/YwtB (metallophosphatase superfamily)